MQAAWSLQLSSWPGQFTPLTAHVSSHCKPPCMFQPGGLTACGSSALAHAVASKVCP